MADDGDEATRPPAGGARGRPRNPAQRPGLSLQDARRIFFAQRSPRIIAGGLALAAAGRVAKGRWARREALIPAAIVALQPFTEWTIHVFLLHFRPRRVAGITIDPLVARKHRAHHADPKDLELVFVPLPALAVLMAGIAAGSLASLPRRRALTAVTSAYSVLLGYEWTHFLIHTAYRPRSAAYRYVWRAHRNHHYRNEHYWFGVTMHTADHLLGTFPERSEVEVSATARTLGVTGPAAA